MSIYKFLFIWSIFPLIWALFYSHYSFFPFSISFFRWDCMYIYIFFLISSIFLSYSAIILWWLPIFPCTVNHYSAESMFFRWHLAWKYVWSNAVYLTVEYFKVGIFDLNGKIPPEMIFFPIDQILVHCWTLVVIDKTSREMSHELAPSFPANSLCQVLR
jgi:hypothetical protein